MQNILFVLYEDFHSNSALHVHHFANNLITLGCDCVVAVPQNKQTVAWVGKTNSNLYQTMNFDELNSIPELFKNHQWPDIVHLWTPREVNRNFWEQLSLICHCKLVVHLEDNEDIIIEKTMEKPMAEIMSEVDQLDFPQRISHPQKYRELLDRADGVTVIIDQLREFVSDEKSCLTLWPGIDNEHFFPRERNPELANKIGIPENSIVLCYTGNVHATNTREVMSLYLAISLLNREGQSAVLVRTGRDFCDFPARDELHKYSIELGYIAYEIMPEILALADVLVQPGRPDQFNDYRLPCKLPEFLAMGKPVILPNTNIGFTLKHTKEAIILPIVDATNIVDYVNLLMNDRTLYRQLSQGSVNFAKTHLNWQNNSELLMSFYQKL